MRYVAFAEQPTFGTPVAADDSFIEATGESVKEIHNHEAIATIRTNAVIENALLNVHVEGPVEFAPSYDGLPLIVDALFGGSTATRNTPVGANTYVSPITATPDLPAKLLTLGVARVNGLFTYADSIIDSLSLAISTDASATGTLTVNGSICAATLPPIAAGPTPLPFEGFKPVTTCIQWNGSPTDCVGFNIDIVRSVDTPFTLCATGYAAQQQQNVPMEVSGSFTLIFTDLDEYDDFQADLAAVLVFTATGVGGTGNSCVISMPLTRLTQGDPEMDGRDRILQPIEFVCEGGAADLPVQFTIICDTDHLTIDPP